MRKVKNNSAAIALAEHTALAKTVTSKKRMIVQNDSEVTERYVFSCLTTFADYFMKP